MMIDTIFFDFDGVVIDSEPVHAKTKAMVLDAYNINYPEDIFDKYKGVPEKDFFIHVSDHLDPKHQSKELFIEKRHDFLSEILPEMPVIEGFFEFLDFAKANGIRTALVTSATTRELKNVDKYLNVISLFDHVVSAEATEHHKPHPAPYLKALEVMKADSNKTLIIEDSPNGIISGKKSGCKVFALTTSFSREEIVKAGADEFFDNYEGLRNRMIC